MFVYRNSLDFIWYFDDYVHDVFFSMSDWRFLGSLHIYIHLFCTPKGHIAHDSHVIWCGNIGGQHADLGSFLQRPGHWGLIGSKKPLVDDNLRCLSHLKSDWKLLSSRFGQTSKTASPKIRVRFKSHESGFMVNRPLLIPLLQFVPLKGLSWIGNGMFCHEPGVRECSWCF